MKAKFIVPSIFVALGSGYAYLQYFKYASANKKADQLIKSKKLPEYLYQLHESLSFNLDKILDEYEKFTKISEYRRILCSFTEGKILQTCSGTSRNLKYFPEGSDVTLMDYSANCTQMAMTKVNTFIKTKHVIGQIQRMPFQNNQFDTVIDTFGLDYVIQPQSGLKQIRRVCKPGGNILLMQSGLSSQFYLNYWQKFKSGYNLLNFGYFCDRNWQQIIQNQGFQIIKKQRKINGSIYFYILRNNKTI